MPAAAIGSYDPYTAADRKGRVWRAMTDGSIHTKKRVNGVLVNADRAYSCEVVSPILQYEDMDDLQEIVRLLRKAGAVANESCGIHIHVDASPHNVKTLRNIVNIMAAKEDLLYKTLKVDVHREHYCAKADTRFLDELNSKRPSSMSDFEHIWYNGPSGRNYHYDETRYHGLNLHSVFSKGTIDYSLK